MPGSTNRQNSGAYIDDVVIKTRHVESLIDDLRVTFDNLRAYDIKLNPEKCVFDMPTGKILGFIISNRGIKANPAKIQALSQLATPTDLKQIKKINRMCGCLKPLYLPTRRKGITSLSRSSAHRTLRVDRCGHGRIGRNKSPLGQ